MVSDALRRLPATVIALLSLAAPAQAAFPGVNGRLVMTTQFLTPPGCTYNCTPQMALLSALPDGSRVRRHDIGAGGFNFTASPDGRRLAYEDPRGGISVVKTDGTGARRVTRYGHAPAWSPDGRHLVFSSEGLFVASVDGGTVRHVRGTGTNAEQPTWSPDGRRIAFVATNPGRDPLIAGTSLHVVVAAGGKPKRVYRPPFDYGNVDSPDWAPDSRRLVLHITEDVPDCEGCPAPVALPDPSARHRVGINTIHPDGHGLRRLVSIGQSPVWSPDGHWIAYLAEFALRVKPARGGPATNVLTYESRGGATGPTWLPRRR